jgi:Ras-related protein Rab-6A
MVFHRNQVYRLMLWDTAGQERFSSLIPSFVRGCDCAVIVYDMGNAESLEHCEKWLRMVSEGREEQSCSVVLVGNKADLGVGRGVSGGEMAIKHGL